MAKSYIGKALGTLTSSGRDMPIRLARNIASKLSDMQPSKVRSIDSDLNFNGVTVMLKTRGRYNAQTIIENRRLAILISKTMTARVEGDPTCWDENELEGYISGHRRVAAEQPEGNGYYLAGSFWAYSDHADRIMAREAWTEAKALCKAGIWAIGAMGDRRILNLQRRWFGTANLGVASLTLQNTLLGLEQRRVGFGYTGKGAIGNTHGLQEDGMGPAGNVSSVTPGSGWGSTKYGRADSIVLGPNFFDKAMTSGQRSVLHGLTREDGMQVSRGGTVLHEATHLFANTNDEYISDAVYNYLNIVRGDKPRAQGYGPFTCASMAAADPDTTLTNADSYRLFCEDSFVLQQA